MTMGALAASCSVYPQVSDTCSATLDVVAAGRAASTERTHVALGASMSKQTVFLSRLLGLYCLIVACAMLAQRQFTLDAVAALLRDPPLLYVLGVLLLFAGLAMVLAHNSWRGGPVPVIVTLIGWLTLLKGMAFVGLLPVSADTLYLVQLRFEQLYYFYAVVTVALGAYLTYFGFRRFAHPAR
jgi:hypothetical protein